MDSKKTAIAYAAIVLAVIGLYGYSVGLLTVQTAWINVSIGKVTASYLAALIIWPFLVERIGKKRKWKPRTIWAVSLSGVGVMVLSISVSPPM